MVKEEEEVEVEGNNGEKSERTQEEVQRATAKWGQAIPFGAKPTLNFFQVAGKPKLRAEISTSFSAATWLRLRLL